MSTDGTWHCHHCVSKSTPYFYCCVVRSNPFFSRFFARLINGTSLRSVILTCTSIYNWELDWNAKPGSSSQMLPKDQKSTNKIRVDWSLSVWPVANHRKVQALRMHDMLALNRNKYHCGLDSDLRSTLGQLENVRDFGEHIRPSVYG